MICPSHGAELRRRTSKAGFQDACVELSLYVASHGIYVLEHNATECFFCNQGIESLEAFLSKTLKGDQLAA